jgi:hypothetical protein
VFQYGTCNSTVAGAAKQDMDIPNTAEWGLPHTHVTQAVQSNSKVASRTLCALVLQPNVLIVQYIYDYFQVLRIRISNSSDPPEYPQLAVPIQRLFFLLLLLLLLSDISFVFPILLLVEHV